MTTWDYLRLVFILGPIAAMLALGVLLATRSGVGSLASRRGVRLAFVNLSHAVVMLGACLVGLFVIQQLIGQPVPRAW